MTKLPVVYFSNVSEQTKRFVEKLPFENIRIPIHFDPKTNPLVVDRKYVLITPSYGAGNPKGAVPKQVVKFLANRTNRANCVAVVAGGNRNFAGAFGIAGKVCSDILGVPLLGIFELSGNDREVCEISERIVELNKSKNTNTK